VHTFDVVRLDTAALVWTGRRLDGSGAPQLYRLLEQLVAAGATTLVVDLVAVPSVDEAATEILGAAAGRLRQLDRSLVLCLPGADPVRVRNSGQLRSMLHRAYPTAA
jgi:anti-anti-sigma regulatory factor